MKRLLLLTVFLPTFAAAQPYGSDKIPFHRGSVWNMGMGSGQQWSNPNDADARQLHSLNGGINSATWGQPIFFGSGSDPVMRVTNADPVFPVPAQTVHVPAGAQPAQGTDRHMAFYDATQPGVLWSYFGCSVGFGTINCALGGVWDTSGDGVHSAVNPGSDYNFAVGTITDYDLSQGTIAHAVRFSLSTDAARAPGATWTDNIPWPNTHIDYNGPSMYTGQIVAGSTIGIPAGLDLRTLGLSPGGMMLAKALQEYGGIWRDSGGSNQITFYSTPESANNPLIQQMQADMGKIVPQLEILRNQGPNSVNGGGQSIITSAGPFTGTNPASVMPKGVAEQIADLNVQIDAMQANIQKIASTQSAAILDLAPHLPVATQGKGQVTDAMGIAYTVTPAGSIMANGSYVDGGGDTAAVTSVNGTIWGQDSRNGKWFTWNGAWWKEQTHAP